MENKKIHFGFTLIEIIVSITILSIIMVSIMMIFSNSSQISLKVDINRAIQENVKNIIETMAEDVRKNGINVCASAGGSDCHFIVPGSNNFVKSDTLYLFSKEYYLAKQTNTGDWIKVLDQTECDEMKEKCAIAITGGHPLSNTSVVIKDLKFYVSKRDLSEVTVSFAIAPSPKKGVKSSLIQSNVVQFQTTISERLIKNN